MIFWNFQVLKCVQEYITTMEDGLLVFRYEPFILAVECRTPAAAQTLVQCAVSAGFRESGKSYYTHVCTFLFTFILKAFDCTGL